MLEILKNNEVIATIRPGSRFKVPDEQRVVFNVTLDTRLPPGYTIREYTPPPPPEPEPPSYEEKVFRALAEVAPLPVLLKEVILAMNHAQLSGAVNWSSHMDRTINRSIAALNKHKALTREEEEELDEKA